MHRREVGLARRSHSVGMLGVRNFSFRELSQLMDSYDPFLTIQAFSMCSESFLGLVQLELMLHAKLLKPTLKHIQKLLYLQDLRFWCSYYNQAEVNEETILLPHLERLSVTTPTQLHSFEAPNLTFLQCNQAGTFSKDTSPFPLVYSQILDGIQMLNWPQIFSYIWNTRHKFTNLHKVIFRGDTINDTSHFFMQGLLLGNLDCPQLEIMELRAYPEWSLLFRFLLARNFSPSPIRPIRALLLPSIPPPSLLSPLKQLLSGKYPRFVPDFNPSWNSMAAASLDPAMFV